MYTSNDIEVLVSTMNNDCKDLFDQMNIKSNALVINQSKNGAQNSDYCDGKLRRIMSVNDKGLSKSRNMAINNSNSEILMIADDDVVYNDDMMDIIADAFNKYKDADIIAFNVESSNAERPTSKLSEGKVSLIKSMKIASFQIALKKKSVSNTELCFNELFGAGSYFYCGEENIYLYQALKKGLKIYFVNKNIGIVNHKDSTWFEGFNGRYFQAKGAMFYSFSKVLFLPYVLQFLIRKYSLYHKTISPLSAFKNALKGKNELIRFEKKKAYEK